MKKKILIPLMIVFLLSSFTIISNALSFGTTLSPEIANVPPGETIDLYISTAGLNAGSNGINMFSCKLNYDNTIFEELSNSNITGLNGWNFEFDSEKKEIIMDNTNYVTEDVQLCKITFTIKSTIKEGTGEISITNPQASNGKLDIIGIGSSAVIHVKQISSEKYEITEDHKITGVKEETTVDDFKSNIIGSENATIKDKNGTVITSNSKVGTGTTVEIPGEEPFTVIVKGDINGDGKITVTDLAKVQLHIVKLEMLNGPYTIAADINEDEKVTVTDLAKLQLHIVGLEKL